VAIGRADLKSEPPCMTDLSEQMAFFVEKNCWAFAFINGAVLTVVAISQGFTISSKSSANFWVVR